MRRAQSAWGNSLEAFLYIFIYIEVCNGSSYGTALFVSLSLSTFLPLSYAISL